MGWGRKRERVLSSPSKEECGHELRISKVSVIVKEEPFFSHRQDTLALRGAVWTLVIYQHQSGLC